MKYRLAYKTKSMFKFKNGSTAGGVNAVIVNYRAYKGLLGLRSKIANCYGHNYSYHGVRHQLHGL